MPPKPSSKKSKMSPAIVVALIGLVGTIVTALFASPVLIELIKRSDATETPAGEPSVPAADASLVFSEDFEDGNTSGFGFVSGTWEVAVDRADPGNAVLQTSALATDDPTTKTFFGPSNFVNGIIEFRCKFLRLGDLYFDFRYEDSGTYVLYFSAKKQYVALAGNMIVDSDWEYSELSPESIQPFNIEEDTWYSVRLEAQDQQFIVSVDGNRLIAASDARLDAGRLRFVLGSGAVVYLDDIQVWETK